MARRGVQENESGDLTKVMVYSSSEWQSNFGEQRVCGLRGTPHGIILRRTSGLC
jgi:hypothetical protein